MSSGRAGQFQPSFSRRILSAENPVDSTSGNGYIQPIPIFFSHNATSLTPIKEFIVRPAIVLLVVLVFLAASTVDAQTGKSYSVPTVVTAHYGKSEPESHGVVTVMADEGIVKVAVKDLGKNNEYEVVLLNEATGERTAIGKLKTDGKGAATLEHNAKNLLKTHNALLVVAGDDVLQYAQLHESSHGCICRHSGGTIVTRRLDQECYECPCGVNYEICCGGKK